jgi:hypothetical protein
MNRNTIINILALVCKAKKKLQFGEKLMKNDVIFVHSQLVTCSKWICMCVCVCLWVVMIIESWAKNGRRRLLWKAHFPLVLQGEVSCPCMHGCWVRISGNPTDTPTRASSTFFPFSLKASPLFTLNIQTIALDPTFGSFYLIRTGFFGESV